MRLRFYCTEHDALWAYSRFCDQSLLDDAEGKPGPRFECKFERVALVKETSWRLRNDFQVLPLADSGKP